MGKIQDPVPCRGICREMSKMQVLEPLMKYAEKIQRFMIFVEKGERLTVSLSNPILSHEIFKEMTDILCIQLLGNYSVTGFKLTLRRKMGFYIITYYFPTGSRKKYYLEQKLKILFQECL